MAKPSRLFVFEDGPDKVILSAEMNAELDQLIGCLTNINTSGTFIQVPVADTADKITHSATTKYLVVGASAFRADTHTASVTPQMRENYIRPNAADGVYDTAYADLNLPIGATIISITLYGDTAAGVTNEIAMSLVRALNTAGTTLTIGNVTINDDTDSGIDSSISNPVVDSGYFYYLGASLKSSTDITYAKIFAAVIAYTVVNAKQTI